MKEIQQNSAFAKLSNECPQCGANLIAPAWSEFLRDRCIRHLWNCDACGHAYETNVYLVPRVNAQNMTEAAA